ncbi:MAG: hypothetical protein GY854_07265 [Deltaproteobacteria bacterium]|nr:hypothetical protein [Deltaproteobacteria bacterium]
MRQTITQLLMLAVVIVTLSIVACDEDSISETPSEASATMVLTTDYESGAFSTVDPADQSVAQNVRVIHSDSICRFDPITGLPYIVSRGGADSITVVNPENGWSVNNQYSVGAGTNAQDIAVVSSERAYVPRFGDPSLLIVHPTQGDELGQIDLSSYADEDGNPEAALIYNVDGEVFVGLQRIDETWAPTDYSSVLVIDGTDGSIIEEIQLTAKNPVGKLRYSDAVKSLVLIEAGALGALDGGIEYLDPITHTLSGLVISEETLGGDVSDAVIATETKGYAVIGVYEGEMPTSQLVSFNPSTGEKLNELIISAGWDLSYLELSPDSAELWVADRTMNTPGIRIFDVSNDNELTTSPIDVGLPPSMVCFTK